MEAELVRKRRGAVSTACLRCHRRKQRCVGYPICGNCRNANVVCSRHSSAALRRLAGLSKEELLKRIESLEERLCGITASTQVEPEVLEMQPQQSQPAPYDHHHQPHRHSDPHGHTSDPHDIRDPKPLEPLSQLPDIASTVRQEEERSASLPPMDDADLPQGTEVEDEVLHTIAGRAVGNEASRRPMLTAFLENMHRRVPFCRYVDILKTNEGEIETQELTHSARMSLIRLYMACAIGARVKHLISTALPAEADQFLSRALAIRAMLQEEDTSLVDQSEIALWLVLYKLRTSYTDEVWALIGSAMRMAVAADLHRERHYHNLVRSEAERHCLLFWAIYTIERNVCWAMKRPLSLADYDIDARLPEPLSHPACIQSTAAESISQSSGSPRRPVDIRVFIATIKLARINSQIYVQAYRTDHDCAASDVLPLLEQVRKFEASMLQCSSPDYEFLQLHVKNTIRVLIEPLLPTLEPSDPLTRSCLNAAGEVCRLFKRLRFSRNIGFSFTMVKAVFLAGLTICFIISKAPSYWTPARANDLRACSSSLYAAAEKNSSVWTYCETLDTIIEGMSDYIERVSNAIPTTSPLSILPDGQKSPNSGSSPVSSQACTERTPEEAFNRLRHEFREVKRKFACPSYPNFSLESRDMMLFGGQSATEVSAASDCGLNAAPQLDLFNFFSEGIDIGSLDLFAAGNHYI